MSQLFTSGDQSIGASASASVLPMNIQGWCPKFRIECLCIFLFYFILFIYYFLLYNIVLVLPYINMQPPRVYTCSPSWTPLPPPSPYHPSGSSQCTSPKLPVSCIQPGLAIWMFMYFKYHLIHGIAFKRKTKEVLSHLDCSIESALSQEAPFRFKWALRWVTRRRCQRWSFPTYVSGTRAKRRFLWLPGTLLGESVAGL